MSNDTSSNVSTDNQQHILFIQKYTPNTLEEFNLLPEIFNSLSTLITTEHLNLLLIGSMGSGKTNIIHSIIKEYYKDIHSHLYTQNILYINNLHEQGINYYRGEVKTFCQTSSMIRGKKKIVVIDDIDMINEQSQQVFRNCIDKYSHNVCFLSSCTNNQKVIESIQSRLTLISLPNITNTILYSIFQKIIATENISIDKDAIDFIINVSNKTIKNLINYAEKCKLLNSHITYEMSLKICSDIDIHMFDSYTTNIKAGKLREAINIIYDIVDDGYSVMDILNNYFGYIKTSSSLSEDEKYAVVPYICKYITAFHDIHENDIELPLFTNNLVKALSVK